MVMYVQRVDFIVDLFDVWNNEAEIIVVTRSNQKSVEYGTEVFLGLRS